MATITPTPADLRISANSRAKTGRAGESVAPFDLLYQDADGSLKKAVNTSSNEATVVGIAITYAAINGIVAYVSPGVNVVSSSALWTQGATYVVSDTPGQMMLAGDVDTGDFVTMVGIAESSTELIFSVLSTGIEST